MATLDDKILDGPNVGYCSDSDEDTNNKINGFYSETSGSSAPRLSQRSQEVGTGPKGVLADYRRYEEQKSIERNNAELKLIKEAKRFTLEEAGNRSSSEDEDDDLAKIRQRRLEQLRNFARSRIIEIADSEQFLKVTDNTFGSKLVFIHIYRDGLEATGVLNDALLEIASRSDAEESKFYKVKASVLGTSATFLANGLPALQIYQRGELVGNFVRITDQLGEDFTALQLHKFLEKNDIDMGRL